MQEKPKKVKADSEISDPGLLSDDPQQSQTGLLLDMDGGKPVNKYKKRQRKQKTLVKERD
jgi:hypothetical protein